MASPPASGPRRLAPGSQPGLPFQRSLDTPATEPAPEARRPAPDRTHAGLPAEGCSAAGAQPRRAGLAQLLADLGPHQLRLGAPAREDAAPRGAALCRATGIEPLDRLLGGGFPPGRLSELTGRECSGRTSLLLAWLARLAGGGAWSAWIDLADAFDPPSAAAAGVELERVLWIRPPDVPAALRAGEHVLATGGFAGLVLDLTPRPHAAGGAGERSRRPGRRGGVVPPAAAWSRLRRAACATGTALVVAAPERQAGPFADLALEVGPGRARFGEGPSWLEALEASIRLVRRRGGAVERVTPLPWKPAA